MDRSLRILIIIYIAFIILTLPWSTHRGLIGVFSISFYSLFVFLAVQGTLVLWEKRNKFKTHLGTIIKWALSISFVLASFLTIIHVETGTVVSVAGFEVRSIEHLVDIHSAEGGLLLFSLLWLLLFALALFFVAVISGGAWLLTGAVRTYMPLMLVELRELAYDGKDPKLRRTAAWLLSIPNVLDLSTLRLQVRQTDASIAKQRMYGAIGWQVAIGTLIGIYISLNPELLSVLPYAQTFELVSLPVGLIPLLFLPILTLGALGARVSGPRTDFVLEKGAKNRLLQAMLTFIGLFALIWWAVNKVGASRIAVTFTSYLIVLFLFSILTSFIYFKFFEDELVGDIEVELKDKGF